MITDPNYLIVYGTLRPPFTNPAARYLRLHSLYVGEASFPGLLFDLGGYPGALFQPKSPTSVYASIYHIGQYKNQLLTYLDEYEGIGLQFEWPHEYIRTIIPITWLGESLNCWVYLYNLPDNGKQIIASGDYVAHVNN